MRTEETRASGSGSHGRECGCGGGAAAPAAAADFGSLLFDGHGAGWNCLSGGIDCLT